MTSIAQFIKTSEYVCTGRDPVQALAVFLNELKISLSTQCVVFKSSVDKLSTGYICHTHIATEPKTN